MIPQPHALGKLTSAIDKAEVVQALLQDVDEVVRSLALSQANLATLLRKRHEVFSQYRDVLPVGNREGEALALKEAEALLSAPELLPSGKRMTVDEKQAWLKANLAQDAEWQALQERKRKAMEELGRLDVEIGIEERRYRSLLSLLDFCTAMTKALS